MKNQWVRKIQEGASRLLGREPAEASVAAEALVAAGTTEAARDDHTVVDRLGDGLFLSGMIPHPQLTESGPDYDWGCGWGYWIDLRVKNLAYDKEVGVIWTEDDWKTAHVAHAHFKHDLCDGYERWGLDLTGWTSATRPPVIHYATFAKMNGIAWHGKEDNWKNYTLHP